ncbi:MAG: alpha/beta hydrolase [Bacteroidales bacterium]|nr:alpha/beta hydrolase [Bacteroidales bacterium]
MKTLTHLLVVICFLLLQGIQAQDRPEIKGPVEYIFDPSHPDGLKAYAFFPTDPNLQAENPAIVIFHGGGWGIGEPSWAFGLAEKYARKGMVAIAAQYRLSDQESITPVEAMEDARNVILWMRKNSAELKIHADSIVAYGWSAGAHLAASAAVFPSHDKTGKINSIPNALVLVSPALSLTEDGWFKQLLLGRGIPHDYSPAEHISGSMPPSIIVIGRDDTVTPLGESELFHENMQKNGHVSTLHVFDGAGHLFIPSDQPDNGWPNPDKEIQARAYHEIDMFLKELGYTD